MISSHCLATSSRMAFGSSPAHSLLMPWRKRLFVLVGLDERQVEQARLGAVAERSEVVLRVGPLRHVLLAGEVRVAERVAQRERQLHTLHRDLFAVQPLDEQVGLLLLLAAGSDRQRKPGRQLRVAARRQRIAHLAGDLGLGHPGQRLFIGQVARGESPIGRPGDGHRALAVQEHRQVLDEAELLDPRRHEAVFVAHFGECLHADRVVHRGLHGLRVEELAAFNPEALLEHEHRVRRLAEERRAVHALALQRLGEEGADLVELLPGLGHRQVVLVLVLEGLLQVGRAKMSLR